jgi:hypothetical protein
MITFSKLGQLGQLGNQMFQYAMLLGLAARHGYDIGIPLELAEAKSRTGTYGKGRLALFDAFTGIVAIDSAGSTPLFRLTETRHEFVPEVVDAPDGTDFEGYFQTERYFRHCVDDVRDAFRFHAKTVDAATKQLPACRPCVSVHIRRGDYKKEPDKFPLVEADWYARALELAGGGHPVVISDDPKWCRRALPKHGFPADATWISGNDAATDLCLMSLCDHHVIANSSFSWWGAWLNPSSEKRVVHPVNWFGPALAFRDTRDVPCPEWIGL